MLPAAAQHFLIDFHNRITIYQALTSLEEQKELSASVTVDAKIGKESLRMQTGLERQIIDGIPITYNETIKDILLLTMKRIREDRGGDTISLCVEDALHLFSYGAPYDIDLRTLGFLDFEGEM